MALDTKTIPNIIIWSWMRTVLRLASNELLIFAFIFTYSFDSQHKCYTSLTDMESVFGITRQTISRNIDNLTNRNLVIKTTVSDTLNPMIKHNCYEVNTPYITELCENSDEDSYQNFLDSYRSILKQKFPTDSTKIDEYLEELSYWHQNKDREVRIKLKDLAAVVFNETSSFDNIADAISELQEHQPKKYPEKDYIYKDLEESKRSTQKKLLQEPKRKSKKALHNEWDVTKREMAYNFVTMRLSGNEELLELLNDFLGTDNGRSYTPHQWEQQLEHLYRYGRTPERMIEGVRTSYMNNYRSLYIADKNEVDIERKLEDIDEYVNTECEGNDELRELLKSYVLEVPKGKSYTQKQFKLLLKQLSSICRTTKEKIDSVTVSYTNAYSALAYESKFNNNTLSEPVDIEEKKQKIHQFIDEGYYYLVSGLEELLIQYVECTDSGKSMSYDSFCVILDNLRLLCFDDNEKVLKVRMAIQNNAVRFATEDFDESRKLKAKSESRETMAASIDRSRKQRVMQEKMKRPNDPRLSKVASLNLGTNFV